MVIPGEIEGDVFAIRIRKTGNMLRILEWNV